MSRNRIEVVRAGYEAFNCGDIQAVFALLHPDVELYQSTEVPWGGLYKGLAQAREFCTKLSRTIESKVVTEQLVGTLAIVSSRSATLEGQPARLENRSTCQRFTFGRSRMTRSFASRRISRIRTC